MFAFKQKQTFLFIDQRQMDKLELIKQCNTLIADIEVEIKEQDFVEAIPLLQDFFMQLKKLEDKIDIFSKEDEQSLEKIINVLASIDTEKIKDKKEVFIILDDIESSIRDLKNQILVWETEEFMKTLSQIKNYLNILSLKV